MAYPMQQMAARKLTRRGEILSADSANIGLGHELVNCGFGAQGVQALVKSVSSRVAGWKTYAKKFL